MAAYYNDNEPFVAQWLRNLIAAGHLAPGDVDERSIREVRPGDLRGYTQHHFFAGIGGWGLALRLAGWPDSRPVWTGSCPCQPFSVAGAQKGFDDPLHLWPEWFRIIRECKPATIFGEQVAGTAGLAWIDAVFSDLEDENYATAAADLSAASVGAPHIRQRLWWVAYRNEAGRGIERCTQLLDGEWPAQRNDIDGCSAHDELGNSNSQGLAQQRGKREASCDALGADEREATERTGAWSDLAWIQCTDGKVRPTKPGLFPLAHGVPGRVGRLRAYGNAIVPQVAAEFIKGVMACLP